MSSSSQSHREHPSTYLNLSNQEELTRLEIQDQMLTTSMGGVLPEQPTPASFQRVLDVGCGIGSWLLETARTYPSISLLVGVDVSRKMIEYSRTQAEAESLSDRVEFHTMDALRMLEFPQGSFDLVNERLGSSYLRTWDWPKLLQEFGRVARPGGVIRVTESETFESTSPALMRIFDLILTASSQAGHLFTPTPDGITSQLASLLRQAGFQDVQTRAHRLEYRAGTVEGQHFLEDMRLGLRTIVPFLQKWTRVPEDYETIYQQMLRELQQPGTVTIFPLLTAWGINPSRPKQTLP